MGEEIYARIMDSADATGVNRIFQKYTPGSNQVIKYLRSRFIYFTDPNFTSICFKIYSYDLATEQPISLIATSDSRTKTEIATAIGADNVKTFGEFETYFEFSPTVSLKSGVTYAFVPNGVWTFTSTSYLAWAKAYPLSSYRTDAKEHIVDGDYNIHPITADQ